MSEVNVSRETQPALAAELAGDALPRLEAFADALASRGELLGLIGPQELPRLWTRHLINSALLAPLLQSGATVADIGSGGGLPGLVLAIIRPDINFLLIEPMERRTEWLSEQANELELENVSVRRGRAEEYHGAFEVDQITARAVTALRKLIPLTAPLLKNHGEFMLLKGSGVDAEITAAQKVLRKHHVKHVRVELLGEGKTEVTRLFRATVERKNSHIS
jgi:16S rRNA (guanine527-N7)-methyltransferase